MFQALGNYAQRAEPQAGTAGGSTVGRPAELAELSDLKELTELTELTELKEFVSLSVCAALRRRRAQTR
jgi:hypothetical protein